MEVTFLLFECYFELRFLLANFPIYSNLGVLGNFRYTFLFFFMKGRRRGDSCPLQASHICRKTFCCPCYWKKRSAPQWICVPRLRRVLYHGMPSNTTDLLKNLSRVEGCSVMQYAPVF